jgi:hypothetical protein
VATNATTALSYYKQSAAKGNAVAAYRAAQRIAIGAGQVHSDSAAFTYYKQAATQGYAPAQRQLGYAYEFGLGGHAVDLVHAWVWYSLADDQGDSIADSNLKTVQSRLTAAQFQQAQSMKNNWQTNRVNSCGGTC